MKLFHLFIFGSLLFVLGSCSVSPEEAEKQATVFYEKLKQHDYEAIKGMLDEEALNANTWEEWLQILSNKEQLGELVSFEKSMGFHTNYQNGVSTISFRYTTEYTDLTLYEFIKLVKRGEEYKVLVYAYYDTEQKLDEVAEGHE
jgi:hypothetical protein